MPKVNARYVDAPSRTRRFGGDFGYEVPLKHNSEDAVHPGMIPPGGAALGECPARCGVRGKTFTESLILAQDERWRRA
ncbi:hypothetical protein GCM10010420_42110 [Streptomyces glaucosporus]|uniref:Uncharacterized protein n=1 Tax=Streptomyces glaucosporus TaxID=284044 RepID=A0ABN3IPH1_9ACTN